jgi:hypothetical protein
MQTKIHEIAASACGTSIRRTFLITGKHGFCSKIETKTQSLRVLADGFIRAR